MLKIYTLILLVASCGILFTTSCSQSKTTHDEYGVKKINITDTVFYLQYTHHETGEKHRGDAIKQLQAEAQKISKDKGFREAKIISHDELDILDIQTDYKEDFAGVWNKHAQVSMLFYHLGKNSIAKTNDVYLMTCNADIVCEAIDAATQIPDAHTTDRQDFNLEFRQLRGNDDQAPYEHVFKFYPDNSVRHFTDDAKNESETNDFSFDFAMNQQGLISNISPSRTDVIMPYGELNTFRGWCVLAANNAQIDGYFFLSWEPTENLEQLKVWISVLSSEAVIDFFD